MPIEIKELHIRVTVNTPSSEQASATKTASSDSSHHEGGETGDNNSLISECVEQVLQILDQKKER
jgi:hypothetical protein